jgi:GNAT superfamily N-acetyltransferase
MANWTCEGCAAELSAESDEALVGVALAHLTETHPEWQVTEMGVRNYFAALERLTGGTERLDHIGTVEIRPTGPENTDDVVAFFDHDAFAGNPAWASCYCLFHHIDRAPGLDEWGRRSAEDNRADLDKRLRERSTWGWVAYVDGKVGGWVNASPRSAFPDHATGTDDDATTGSIVCFIIGPPYRRHGLGKQLLQAACDGLKERGMKVAEAYPVLDSSDDAGSYPGPISLFEGAGFERVEGGNEKQGVARKILV